jgi:hypothetical protein
MPGPGDILTAALNSAQSIGGVFSSISNRLNTSGLFPGAQPSQQLTSVAKWSVRTSNTDFRVKIVLPPNSPLQSTFFTKTISTQEGDGGIQNVGSGGAILSPLSSEGGVIFPLTPNITLTHSASYQESATTHSNYPFYAYSHTESPQININGDFPVQNYQDAQYWVGMVHFFRSITKMFFGTDDPNRGNPPPILWLKGYGDYVFNNVPVVVKTFSVTMGQDVDYISTQQNVNAVLGVGSIQLGGSSSWAPTLSTVNLVVQPIYSRESIKNFSLTQFIQGNLNGNTNTRGFI